MRRFIKFILKISFVTGVLLSSGVSASFANCLSWENAREVIRQHGLLNAGTVRQRSQELGGKIIELKLCEHNGQYVYQVGVLVPGKVKHMIVDARTGAVIGGQGGQAIDYAGAAGQSPEKTYRGFKFEPDAYGNEKK